MTLDDQLRALRQAERRLEPPAGLEARVLAAFDDRRRQAPTGGRSSFAAMALAAGVLLGVGGTVMYYQRTADAPAVPAQQVSESVVFVLEPPGAEETVRVVRIRVARSALASLGIQTVAAQDGDTVEVDVLVGEDGVARGVRLAM